MARAPLLPDQARALERLAAVPALRGFYVAGGSAVACHLHHRESRDVDLFTSGPFDPAVLAASFPAWDDLRVSARTDVMLRLELGAVPIDLVGEPYPLLDPTTPGPAGFALPSLRDLGTSKLATVASRGLRRDFWDLRAILGSGIDLLDLARAYVKRFSVRESDLFHVARSLTYFDDAERESVLPRGLTRPAWQQMKAFFRREAPRLLEIGPT